MSEHLETMFLFEFLVESIRLERLFKASHRLAVGVRLLDFPLLLIDQPGGNKDHTEREGHDRPGEYTFNRGKSCFFKMNRPSLHVQLSNTPLYAMVLDATEGSPRLVGSSLISLAKAVDRVEQGGVSSPSSHRERGLVSLCDLAGERIGTISLSYKLVSLGASLLSHIAEKRGFKGTGGQQQERVKEKNKSPESNVFSPTIDKLELNVQSNKQTDSKILLGEDKLDDSAACVSAESPNAHCYEEDVTVFCPPHLYYSNTAQERSSNKEVDYKFPNLDLEAFTFEDSCLEDEKDEGLSSQRKVVFTSNMSSGQEASGGTPNILREALKKLPLLNALVAELSQLTDSGNPSPAWIYKPEDTGTHLKHPRNCSTPIFNPAKDSQEEILNGNQDSSKSHRTKLVYGTTKTFNLRLKQASSLQVKHRECTGLLREETQTGAVTGKTKSSRKTIKSSKVKSVLNRSHNLNENIETAMQSVPADPALQTTVTLKQKAQHDEQNSDEREDSEKAFHPQRALKCIHLPSVDRDSIPPGKDKHQSRSDQSESDNDNLKVLVPRVKEKRNGSPDSFSESSINGKEDGDYTDDFDSLESSDASPPKPGSPESSRAKTPKSPICSSSRSEGTKQVPVPVKVPGSPRRALMGTHIIRPRTPSSALSFSTDGDDRDASASLQTVCSRKRTTAGDRGEPSSDAASFLSSLGERTESPGDRDSVQGFSDKSISSFEAQEAEEMEEELGSLNFRKEYQHISELVINKLPGYTM
ncbi:microtubule-associated protein 10 [Nematolebias whitei]|uniref:microtubule-associated protein 10 n=1 Tax=Nematolebias whitei TaxID=451745 RepID=UPI00189B84EF|nr:microtubule-associated protein 10 [Nematolebias whitei]